MEKCNVVCGRGAGGGYEVATSGMGIGGRVLANGSRDGSSGRTGRLLRPMDLPIKSVSAAEAFRTWWTGSRGLESLLLVMVCAGEDAAGEVMPWRRRVCGTEY